MKKTALQSSLLSAVCGALALIPVAGAQEQVDGGAQPQLLSLPALSADEKLATVLPDDERRIRQLDELWESMLTQSPDLEFVAMKLGANDSPKVKTLLLRSANFAFRLGADPMGSTGCYNGLQTSAALKAITAAGKSNLIQTEAIMLYTMYRTAAEHLAQAYDKYQKATFELSINSALKTSCSISSGSDSLESKSDKLRIKRKEYRTALENLAGVDAVNKLDQKMLCDTANNWL